MRITLSLTFVALGISFSSTPHTGCNDAAPEVVEALAAELGYAPHQFKSCGDVAAAGGCALLEQSAYSETCCDTCGVHDRLPPRMTYGKPARRRGTGSYLFPTCNQPGWCTHAYGYPGSLYDERMDCDGDDFPDSYCVDDAGRSGILSSAN